MDPQQLFDAWREADEQARKAERQFRDAYMRFIDGSGGPPSRELRLKVGNLRRAATERLTAALMAADSAAGDTPPV
jgi:hypothetical protein